MLLAVVRIGVLGLFSPQQLIVKAPPDLALKLRADAAETILSPGKTAVLVRRGNIIEILGREAGTVQISSRAGGDAEFTLGIEGKMERSFRGRLTVKVAGNALVPVIAMERELAVAAVVAAEYPASARLEAQKAMAVLARSYYAASIGRHQGFEFCDTTHCQFHTGRPSKDHPAWIAAEATRHEVLQYQGRTFPPLYFGGCDGETRSASDIGLNGTDYPYFRIACGHSIRRWRAKADPRLDGTESTRLRVNRERGDWALKSNSYTTQGTAVEGKGEGHLAGLCQQGAAEHRGTYREILSRYYPNTSLSVENR